MKKEKSIKNEKLQIALIVLCTLIFIGCAIWLILYLVDAGKGAKQADSLKSEYIMVEGEPVDGEVSQPGEPIDTEEPKEKVVIDGREYDDFAELDVSE